MPKYIDADALLNEWGIEIPENRPIHGAQCKENDEFKEFMKKYENHPYYFAILAIFLADAVDEEKIVKDYCEHRGLSIVDRWFLQQHYNNQKIGGTDE